MRGPRPMEPTETLPEVRSFGFDPLRVGIAVAQMLVYAILIILFGWSMLYVLLAGGIASIALVAVDVARSGNWNRLF